MRKQLVFGMIVAVVLLASLTVAYADAGGGPGSGHCMCVLCGASCEYMYGGFYCVATQNPYIACYWCMMGCGTVTGSNCCDGPPTW